MDRRKIGFKEGYSRDLETYISLDSKDYFFRKLSERGVSDAKPGTELHIGEFYPKDIWEVWNILENDVAIYFRGYCKKIIDKPNERLVSFDVTAGPQRGSTKGDRI